MTRVPQNASASSPAPAPPPHEAWSKSYTSATVALGEHILSVPWKENTIKARQLLLATSVGAVVVLAGAKTSNESLWQQIRNTLGADVLVLFIAGLLVYALVGYFIASSNDIERYRLLTLQRTNDYEAQLRGLAGAREWYATRLAGRGAAPPSVERARTDLAAAKARVRDLQSAVDDVASRNAIDELREAMARRDELEAEVDGFDRERNEGVMTALRGLLDYAGATATIDTATETLFAKAKRGYVYQTRVEQWGPLIFGSAVFIRVVMRIVSNT